MEDMMAVARSPLRISFLGGGTDYPDYFLRRPGVVVGTTIDRYVYVAAGAGALPSASGDRFAAGDHPILRALDNERLLGRGARLMAQSDLPFRSGLGSSSSLTVAALRLLGHYRGESMSAAALAEAAVALERRQLAQRGGHQDQYHAAFGGLRRYVFGPDGVTETQVEMLPEVRRTLDAALYLVHAGVSRPAPDEAAGRAFAEQARGANAELDRQCEDLAAMARQGFDILQGQDADRALTDFAGLIHQGWMIKRRQSSDISSPVIDALYDRAIRHGALGGKLCGSGGGGFLLLLIPPDEVASVQAVLAGSRLIKINLHPGGAELLHGPV